MRNLLIATLVVTFFLCVVDTEGVDLPTLPARLSIGSFTALNEGAVTINGQSFGTTLYYTNNAGVFDSRTSGLGTQFQSFATYKAYTISNTFWMFSQFRPEMDPNKVLRWRIYVGFGEQSLGNTFNSLVCDTKIGTVSSVTSNTFANAFNPTNICAIVPVQGLQQFMVEVKNIYTNSWPAPINQSSRSRVESVLPYFPPERTTNNVVILNPWYSLGTNEVRFTIKAGGKTRRYTQFGDALDTPPVVAMTNECVTASFARGALARVESSTNLVNWTIVANISDTEGLGFISLPYTINKPCQFYRVGIQ